MDRLLGKGLKALRIGPPVKLQSHLIEHSLEYYMENDQDYQKIEEEELILKSLKNPNHISATKLKIDKLRSKLIQKVVNKFDVICCTCVSIGHKMYQSLNFPFVIIDECTQSIEPASMIPIMKGCKHLVLIGDHHQLPPTILSLKAKELGLEISLFERLVKNGMEPHLLTTQYRMHPSICEFSSKEFYESKILNGVEESDRAWKCKFDFVNPKIPISFYDLDINLSKEEDKGQFKMNKGEIKVVDHLIESLLKGGLKQSDIGVISPYNGQVVLLRQAIYQKHKDIEIKTVDGFQGKEKEVIILSLVRSNKQKDVGFLTDWRRMNVSITRAKRGLFIVGNRDTVSTCIHWKHYIEWIEKNHSISLVLNLEPVEFL